MGWHRLILLAEDMDNWWAPLNAVVNLWFYRVLVILEQLWELPEFQEGLCYLE
jgi:hypothetical protein